MAEMEVWIRQETETDHRAVYEMVEAAFSTMEHSDGDEQNLVERLRKSEGFVPELSLVAELDGTVVGHILFTEIGVGADRLLALAPLAVMPGIQSRGIGGTLIEEGHRISAELGYKGCIVMGHDRYYPKFGYKRASGYQIAAPFEVPDECFMAVELGEGRLVGVRGTVEYPNEFFEK